MSNETKVGFLVVLTIAALLGLSALMGNVNLFGKNGITVTFELNNAAGLVSKSLVKYKGIDVGKVKKVQLINGKVLVDTLLSPDYLIPNNVTVVLSQDGIMGNKFIDLVSKNPDQATGFLKDGNIYSNYVATVSMDELFEKISDIATEVQSFTSTLSQVFGSEKGKTELQDILYNLSESTKSLKHILTNNQDRVDDIVFNLDNFTAKLDQLLNDRNKDNINISMDNIRDITNDLKVTVANLNKITDGIVRGDGTIGMLLSDNDTRSELKETITSLHTMMAKADSLTISLEAGAEYLTARERYHGTFFAKVIPSDQRYYLLGVSNIPSYTTTKETRFYVDDTMAGINDGYRYEKEKVTKENTIAFTIQYALMFNEKLYTLRGGLFENQLGFGADFNPFRDDNLTFSIDVSDFYREKYGTRVKINAKYRFLDHFFLQTGWDDIGTRQNSFTVGAGIYFIDNDLKYVIGSVPTGGIGN